MVEGSTKAVVWILLAVILVLLIFIGYIFLVRPAYTGFVTEKQLEGAQAGSDFVIAQIVQQAATCQAVPLQVGNQTMNLIWIDCLNLGQQALVPPQQ